MEESAYLLTVPLAKDGGMTMWILVERDAVPDQRAILASCETYRKRALVSSSSTGETEDVIVHGIASVFCDPKYRGKGYAKHMLTELARVLKDWQADGRRCIASVLYSDIGPKYYADVGWKLTSNNTHIEFPAHSSPELDGVKLLQAEDLEQLCEEDEAMIRKSMAILTAAGRQHMIIVPDHDHMLWHHTKEEFVSQKLFGRIPHVKGIMVDDEPGKRIWAIWTHRFYGDPEVTPSGNVLYILRLVIEDLLQDSKMMQAQLKRIFQSAQAEAAAWNLDVVKLWDPHPRVQRLMRRMDIGHSIVERNEDGIASLLWYGEDEEGTPVWVSNEKYAWC
ncbi:hypothetical protein EG329_002848 [Mollisiaceae sp. DMI_Dod_QoI]|nr:hypothetical protein EG329_002848 [Helotiales sp. DMI_Dod_QoI]